MHQKIESKFEAVIHALEILTSNSTTFLLCLQSF